MKNSKVKNLFVLLGLYSFLAIAMFFGFDYLWGLYPEKEIFKTLMNSSHLIAYVLVFFPYLVLGNTKESNKEE